MAKCQCCHILKSCQFVKRCWMWSSTLCVVVIPCKLYLMPASLTSGFGRLWQKSQRVEGKAFIWLSNSVQILAFYNWFSVKQDGINSSFCRVRIWSFKVFEKWNAVLKAHENDHQDWGLWKLVLVNQNEGERKAQNQFNANSNHRAMPPVLATMMPDFTELYTLPTTSVTSLIHVFQLPVHLSSTPVWFWYSYTRYQLTFCFKKKKMGRRWWRWQWIGACMFLCFFLCFFFSPSLSFDLHQWQILFL